MIEPHDMIETHTEEQASQKTAAQPRALAGLAVAAAAACTAALSSAVAVVRCRPSEGSVSRPFVSPLSTSVPALLRRAGGAAIGTAFEE